MAAAAGSDRPAITLGELAALNAEMAALVRAGVPLERGLRELAADLPGRLGRTSRFIADRMAQGEALVEVLDRYPQSFPPVYRAMVAAGIRSGRLWAALESVAGVSRRLADTERMIVAAMVYPLLILLLAWALLVLFAMHVAPRLVTAFSDLRWPGRQALESAIGVQRWLGAWWLVVPLVLIVAAAAWWRVSGTAGLARSRWSDWLIGWLPWVGGMVRHLRSATFAEMLSLLTAHDVPLDEAISLAGQTAGNPRLKSASDEIAAAIRRGEPLDRRTAGWNDLPPLVAGLLSSSRPSGDLSPALAQAAKSYRRRAMRQGQAARALLPTLFTVVIGGSIVTVYTVLLFWPYASLLYTLARVTIGYGQ